MHDNDIIQKKMIKGFEDFKDNIKLSYKRASASKKESAHAQMIKEIMIKK